VADDLLQLIALDDPENSGQLPWPCSGESFQIVIEVEHIGPEWEDEPDCSVLWYPDEVAGLFDQNSLTDLGLWLRQDLPIASGIYVLMVEFFYDKWTSMESWTPEVDYGLSVLSLHKFM
jgi:hypothetical protein